MELSHTERNLGIDVVQSLISVFPGSGGEVSFSDLYHQSDGASGHLAEKVAE